MADKRHKCSRDTVTCTINSSQKTHFRVFMHPIKITAYNILWKEKHKSFFKCIFFGQHSPLNTFGVSYTVSNIPVFLFDNQAFINHFLSSLPDFFLKDIPFSYQCLFPYADGSYY